LRVAGIGFFDTGIVAAAGAATPGGVTDAAISSGVTLWQVAYLGSLGTADSRSL
jgi:hypothetical protein